MNYLVEKRDVNSDNTGNLLKFDAVMRSCHRVKYLLLSLCTGSCETSLVGLSCEIPDP